MTRLVLGVVGHVDHGKTALVHALTGMQTDRLAEERRRGMSIELGFAHAELGGAVDFVDAPGHERFVRTMVGGVTGADAVLAVVAASEGVKPQTREHLTIASLLGVTRGVLALTKADLASPEAIAAAAAQAASLATDLGISLSRLIPVSAVTGAGVGELKAAIVDLARTQAEARDDGFAYLPVDRAFSARGQGVVVTGTLRRGALSAETALELLPAGRAVRIRSLQVHGSAVASARPGQRVAVNLRGVDLETVERGSVLASAGALAASAWLSVMLRAAPDAPPLANGTRLELLIGATRSLARVRLLDRETLEPGQAALAQLATPEPIAVPAGDGFVLRRPSPAATVAGGRVMDPQAVRLRRGLTPALKQLERLAATEADGLVPRLIEDAGLAGLALGRLAALSGLSSERAGRAAAKAGAVRVRGDVHVSGAEFSRAQANLLRLLAAAPAPIPPGELAARARGMGAEVLTGALAVLQASGKVLSEDGRLALHRPDAVRAQADAVAAAARRIAERLRSGGLSPPDLSAETATPLGRRALDLLVRQGAAVRTFDRVQKREILFHGEAVEGARRRLAPRLAPPGVSMSEVGQILETSRKFSVPLMEHLDAVRFTRRVGDRRILAQAADAAVGAACGGD